MKKATIIFLILIIIIATAIIPFLLTSKAKEDLSIASNLIGSLASLITLLIALLLYSKYGVEKSLINKQTEVVFNLLNELKKTRFILESDSNTLFLYLDLLKKDYWKDYKDKILGFDINYFKGLAKIWEIAEDIFLPIEIAKAITPLKVITLDSYYKSGNCIKVQIPCFTLKSKDGFFGKLNNKEINLEEFIKSWNLVIRTSKKWLKDYSSTSVNINFDRN